MSQLRYGVRKGGELVRCFSDHGDAVAFAAELLETWWGPLAVEWYGYEELGGEG
jgi:hypothetical protein